MGNPSSGEEQCEMRVCDTDGESRCHVAEPTGHVCLARLCARPQVLNMETLQGARDRLERCGELGEELGSCLNLALEKFCREPRCVQENARLLIRWGGGELEFIAGQGQCEISVSCSTGEPQYYITEKTWDVFVAWMNSHPEPLSIKNLERIQNTLESWGALGRWGLLGNELSGCFREAISQFSLEPLCMQENARMRISWDGATLELLSGEGQCDISVHYRDGRPQYEVGELSVHMYVAWLRARPEPLSTDTLQRVRDRLGSCKENTDVLRACFDRAWQGFRREPRCVQENARLLIRWGAGELEFVSGQGQCEISVLLADGEPQYHITELGGDRPVTWSHTSPEPLSVTDLARVRDRLGRWGARGEELSSCFGEAISQFSREPPCVQENARMRLCWDRGSLEFLSGRGHNEISVSYQEGNPRYHFHVETLPVHLYVARLRSHKDPLSADSLFNVYTELGLCGGDTAALRACLYTAWRGFSQEPRCVQENARLLIRWDGGELEFLSGQGQYIFSVSYQEGNPRYYLHVETLPVHLYVARLRSRKDPLSADSLFNAYTELGVCGGDTAALRACLHRAWEGFSREPRCVQENARLLIRWDGGELEFVSGQGQCEISVLFADGEPQYHITELGGDRPVTWSHTSPEPLSVADLERVQDRLGRWRALGEELSGCFGEAISQFSQEPPCVQENARMRIRWDGGTLELLSGEGQCEISMCCRDGIPQYEVGELPMHMYVARLRTHPEPLSADSLQRVLRTLGSCQEDTGTLRACISHALDQFVQEPRCVQENARLLIRWGGGELQFVSGQGQCEISVLLADGEPQYHLTELGGDRPVTWSHTSPEPLSVADLARVRDRLGRWGALGEGLSNCFGEAISQFSQEPPCVQENARMRIRWDGGTLELLSGEGQCEISMCCRDGIPQYEVGELPVHMYVARLRTHPEPLSADSLQRVLRKLGSSQEDTGTLRACISQALDQFVQEPRCVQENARLLIRWGAGELQFVSGQGQCEILVLLANGEPQYRITELGGDRPVTWSRTSPEPLSVADLARVRDRLGHWQGLGEELSGCFGEAISQFSREPPCVQGNARMRVRWDGGTLELLSGEGQCEISMCCRDGIPQYEVGELPMHMYMARLRTHPEPLSADTLLRVWDKLESCKGDRDNLRACFHRAWQEFSREPRCVQENARLLIRWGGEELEFVSGQGQCEISVLFADGEPQYHITELGGDRPVTWSHTSPEPLSVADLARVRDRLGRWGALGEGLRGCFGEAISQFSQEPPCVQENARMRIRWDGGTLELLSGEGQCEISMCCGDGRPQYEVGELPMHMYVARLRTHPEPLSADTLQRVLRKLESCKEDRDYLRACFDRAWQGFRREPRCVQENARLLIRWDGQELEFVSGWGQCEISVLLADGEPQYHITELGGDRPVTWSHTSPEPLSVADLERVRDRLGRWGVLGEELSGCFGEAISQFSREPRCVQENARLRIYLDRGSLVFLSGEGEYTFSGFCAEGNPRYYLHVEDLPGHLYVARLRSRKDPLSADSLFKYYTELCFCQGDTAALRDRLHRAWVEFRREPRCVQENARLLIQWGGGELKFVSGQGQCEISVLLADGEPQYHITELGGDRPVTWSHTSPEPLSIADLARVRDRLGHWGALNKGLSGCLGEAISQFSQEPPCVQENARMRIRWDGGTLELLSGEGQCEISVCCRDGRPQYEVGELPMHMYVARLRTHPEPLSADTLQRVRSKLVSCKGDRNDLRACFIRTWEGFHQEPEYVQDNARLLIQWGRRQLRFTSGNGECEISMRCGDGEPQYHVRKIPVHVYMAQLRTHQQSLSADTLQRVLRELGSCHGDTAALRACFLCAWQGFCWEPRCVQENARLLIRWGGGELAFVSGQGQCEISVLFADGEPQYHITELGGDRPVTWSHTSPEPLSVTDLERVRDRLGRWEALGEELSSCLGEAISQFSEEPPCVQENARMRIRWDGGTLELLSGQGDCEISVCCRDGRPQYEVGELPMHMYVARLRTHPEPLSANTLQRVLGKLGSCHGDTHALSACFLRAWQGFCQEPRCVQENARLLIRWDGQELEFVSGQGQCEISVLLADGEPQYHITELGGDRPVTWSHTSPEPLSIADLARLWDRLGRWGALGEGLSCCFGEAISQFSREPRCVQENARLRIRWDGGTLELLSGEGQSEISVCCRDGRPQYEVGELPMHMYVARLRTHPEPLSADSLQRVLRKLESCGGDIGDLRACFLCAWEGFCWEPQYVQENARLLIQWGKKQVKFTSGKGECEISVRYVARGPQYNAVKIPVHVYLAQLRAHQQSLSADTLQRVLRELGSCHGDTGTLRACFDRAWQGFRREPRCVQGNARLLIRWDGQELEFVSRWGKNFITVCEGEEGRIQYKVQVSGWWPWIARLLP